MAVPRVVLAAGLLAIVVAAIGTSRWRSEQEPSSEWRKSFQQAALQIPFVKDFSPLPDDTAEVTMRSVPAALANLRIAAAKTRDTGETARIDFRITSPSRSPSDTGYPRLGIAPGVNYVWRDVVDGRLRLLVIPANAKYKPRWLAVRNHTHPSPGGLPRVVVLRDTSAKNPVGMKTLMAQICDGPCPRDPMVWCISNDTSMFRASDYPVESFARYFARNHVAWEPTPRGQ